MYCPTVLPSHESPTGEFESTPLLNSKDKVFLSDTPFSGDFSDPNPNAKTGHQIWKVMIIILSYMVMDF